ncbi:hypothetical protein ABIC55_003713 [Sporosarcina psychrophila]|uniref:Uncharacterized protein n=1 Tax=Sporosarcina psychrophila TaxID=1476 RepID=A0ABV2KBZ7_SPOPS
MYQFVLQALPYDEQLDKIAEDNMERAVIRKALYEGLKIK